MKPNLWSSVTPVKLFAVSFSIFFDSLLLTDFGVELLSGFLSTDLVLFGAVGLIGELTWMLARS